VVLLPSAKRNRVDVQRISHLDIIEAEQGETADHFAEFGAIQGRATAFYAVRDLLDSDAAMLSACEFFDTGLNVRAVTQAIRISGCRVASYCVSSL